MDLIYDIGQLNKLTKPKAYFWGIKKNSWEDFYRIEVSSQNFDGRPSLHAEVDLIDDAIYQMVEFAKEVPEY